ncbi:MAG: hypothetical protein JWO25_3316 [Alphaproteobacteria bacterium]|nr:hypothetical protein [Alphaproteobacteria bacterium]
MPLDMPRHPAARTLCALIRSAVVVLAFATLAVGRGETQPHKGCSPESPQIGTLYLEGSARLTVYRLGQQVVLGTGAPWCLRDRTPGGPVRGRIDMISGQEVGIVPNTMPKLPGRRKSIMDRIRSLASAAEMLRPGWAGTLGTNGVGYSVPGISSGEAIVARGHRRILIPVNPELIAQTVELWPPQAKRPLIVTVPPHEDEAVFVNPPSRLGAWTVVIRRDPPFTGAFMVSKDAEDAQAAEWAQELALSKADSALLLACLDPARNSLEAYLRLAELPPTNSSDPKQIAHWRKTENLTCGTP